MRRLRQFLTLTRFTALEALRQPIALLLSLTGLAAIVLAPLLRLHNLGSDSALVRDTALALHAGVGLLVAGVAASNALARETRRGTALAVLAKPVERDLFFLAKFAGTVCVVLLFSLCATLATLLSERAADVFIVRPDRIGYVADFRTAWLALGALAAACVIAALANYRRRRPVGSVAALAFVPALGLVVLIAGFFDRWGGWAPFEFDLNWSVLPASALVTLALLVLAALALACSALFGPGPTLVIVAGCFVVGLLSDYLFGRFAAGSLAARMLHTLLPNWQHFWMCDALDLQGGIPWSYVGMAGGYAAVYSTALLAAGIAVFRCADLAGEE